ncbi:hypothetical protein BDK51DRAFT_44763 [Blyttiomyces helicus]|uniref:RRM domain-containing protein n=1 Tax=Blyttiomyces helicus TaxID=388810 RepID=A0A4P9WK49_9FUNG|nr:hypothetical protein BDK51DRAFT_44763 [Blyttiomyces helicus]|eukprot:RKO92353.1 hypothetical protein BDK51DRAFT_44763 [Blyttiomyces helicus]
MHKAPLFITGFDKDVLACDLVILFEEIIGPVKNVDMPFPKKDISFSKKNQDPYTFIQFINSYDDDRAIDIMNNQSFCIKSHSSPSKLTINRSKYPKRDLQPYTPILQYQHANQHQPKNQYQLMNQPSKRPLQYNREHDYKRVKVRSTEYPTRGRSPTPRRRSRYIYQEQDIEYGEIVENGLEQPSETTNNSDYRSSLVCGKGLLQHSVRCSSDNSRYRCP